MTPDDFDLLLRLNVKSTPARWAAFLELAWYLVKHPEQRLAQAVVNTLQPPKDIGTGFVIRFTDGHYNMGIGFNVSTVEEATRYPTRVEAEAMLEYLIIDVEGIYDVRDLPQPPLFYLEDEEALKLIRKALA